MCVDMCMFVCMHVLNWRRHYLLSKKVASVLHWALSASISQQEINWFTKKDSFFWTQTSLRICSSEKK